MRDLPGWSKYPLDEVKNADGTFKANREGAALVYYCADGGILCPECVNTVAPKQNTLDPECPDDSQWLVVDVSYAEDLPDEGEGERCCCDHCGKKMNP